MRETRPVTPRRARPVFGNPSYVAPQYQTKIWGRVVFALLILVLVAVIGVGGGLYWQLHRGQGANASRLTFHVGSGDTVTSIANRLQADSVISNALLFRLDAKLQGLSAKLKVGDFTLRRNMSIDDMVAAFTVFRDKTIQITIPEGWRAEQIAARLQKHGISSRQFMREVRHPSVSSPILSDMPAGKSLEGYLFPNTYNVDAQAGAKAKAIAAVQQMLDALNREFTPAMRDSARRSGLSVYQVLTLASIVEREARVPDERRIIASVYLNRLRGKGWVLNADPTIQYAVGTPKNWWPILTAAQLKQPGPYNTYINAGLPPTPIANPGIASIRAVLNPASTNYFYFVARNDGTGRQAFAHTYAEQLANQQKYHN